MLPRLKTGLWVQAFLRARETQGHFGAVLKRGADEAGALYVVVNHLDGSHDLLAPAPGSAYDEQGERRFVKDFATPVPWNDITLRMDKRKRADPDLWLIEVEDRGGLAGLSVEDEMP
ncbi:MAG: DUF1491 family protein [Phyllobacteriaceae bacterium]|nr:DUF1491 family protein [Phyllobacteriaceae bacterium]